jgi:transposase InsO family protein
VFKPACAAAGVTQSMGCTGSALDNAVAEAFRSTLEFELPSQILFTIRQQARRAVAAWIDTYNLERRQSTARIDGLMMSPVGYEQAHARTRQQADRDVSGRERHCPLGDHVVVRSSGRFRVALQALTAGSG